MASCHNGLVGGYADEGHVPASTIKRLMAEGPKDRGIAVPGRENGAPGMQPDGPEPSNGIASPAAGAAWVSIHDGGGVGIGRSLHAGMVCVADGSELAAEKLDRVLTTDPGTGVMRHADAGYERAILYARATRMQLPMVDVE